MTTDTNIFHLFNLEHLKTGDQFLGCSYCWFRFDPDTAAKPECPDCGRQMSLFTIRDEDVVR